MPEPPEPNMHSRRRTQRLRLKVPVLIKAEEGDEQSFEEEAIAVELSAHGGLLELTTMVKPGQWMVVRHQHTGEARSAIVVRRERASDGRITAGVEFCGAHPKFWQVPFPPEDWFARPPAKITNQEARSATVSAEGRAYLQEEIARVISDHWVALLGLYRKHAKLSSGRGSLRSATLVYVGPEIGYSLTLIGSPVEILRFPMAELKRFVELKQFVCDVERFIHPSSGRIEGLFCRMSTPEK